MPSLLPFTMQLKAAKGYPVFASRAGDLNVVLLRVGAKPDAFDDYLVACRLWQKPGAKPMDAPVWEEYLYRCTADPGSVYARDPMNPKGTAHLAPGHYPSSHTLGLHKNTPAMVQIGPVRVMRDADRDGSPDGALTEWGIFGVNIHGAKNEPVTVGRWSAGCPVVPSDADLQQFLGLVKDQAKAGLGEVISLTVMEIR